MPDECERGTARDVFSRVTCCGCPVQEMGVASLTLAGLVVGFIPLRSRLVVGGIGGIRGVGYKGIEGSQK